ncbi:3-dehydroquinate synthase [bacterium HR39]|nr:3-dehydroquinate synthase [bacterium HR39]
MNDVETLRVELGSRSYPVHIGSRLLERAGGLLRALFVRPRAFVVTDEQVAAAGHAGRLEAGLREAGITAHRIVLPPGEATKDFAHLQQLLERLLDHAPERNDVVVALGGGVIGDLAGLAAALLLRGVPLVQVPTTLLAQVDSAVGGKTGIDTRHGKNLVGAFKQPAAVLVDLDTLRTLPPRELRAGYAEVVKYGCIRDASFFSWLEAEGVGVTAGEVEAQRRAVRRSLAIKAEIVARDETETSGERALLNFGHTFAHAFEVLAGYDGRLLHGEAVACGMVMAARLSEELGMATADDRRRLEAVLERAGLPLHPRDLGLAFPPAEVLAAMRHDKKVRGGRLRFVLWRGPGRAGLVDGVPEETVLRVLAA